MKKVKHGGVFTAIFSIISIGYIFPILLVFINSFKKKAYISRKPFDIPTGKMYVGLENYFRGIKQANFFEGAKWSTVITVGSVFLIILCTSMCAWYIVRVKNALTKAIYYLCLFAMIVPFQMEMFTLSKLANSLGLNTPWGLWIIYLGFGAGLSVFMFTGFVKSIPIEIEEAANDRWLQSAADFLWCSASSFEANMCDSCNSSDYVDLERLPASVPCIESEKIHHYSDCCPVS